MLTSVQIEKLKEEIYSLREETIKKVNIILERLEYPTEKLFLGTELEFLYPYIVVGQIKMDFKTVEKYLANPTSHSLRFFIENYIDPLKSRTGVLVCPLPNDPAIGIHNIHTFPEECLNDLINYHYGPDFEEFINKFYTQVLSSNQLKRKYGIPQNTESIHLDTNEKLKRGTIILYLKSLNQIS